MSTAPAILEVVEPSEQKELLAVVSQHSLAVETAQNLQASFAPLFAQARDVLARCKGIVVTNANQKLEIDLARACHRALKKIRLESDSTRKTLKDESLRKGRAIDGFHNILLHLTEAEENRLEEQWKFIERQEEARKAELKLCREKALAPYGVDTSSISLGEMADVSFAQLLENTQVAHEAKLAAARKAEEDRIRIENDRLKEEARIREENATLKRQAEEREAQAKAERERLEAIAAEERRKAAEAAAIAQKEKDELEAKNRADKEAAEKKAAQELEKQKRQAAEAAEKERARVAEEKRISDEKARIERESLEKQAEDARIAQAKAEEENRLAKEAAAKKAAKEMEDARQAQLAPDKEKLQRFAAELRSVTVPDLASEEAGIVRNEITLRLGKLALWIEKEASVL